MCPCILHIVIVKRLTVAEKLYNIGAEHIALQPWRAPTDSAWLPPMTLCLHLYDDHHSNDIPLHIHIIIYYIWRRGFARFDECINMQALALSIMVIMTLFCVCLQDQGQWLL